MFDHGRICEVWKKEANHNEHNGHNENRRRVLLSVIPAKAGIQPVLRNPGFRRAPE